jgi:hypothetical protein
MLEAARERGNTRIRRATNFPAPFASTVTHSGANPEPPSTGIAPKGLLYV